jgi:hypothetical protein
MNVEEAATVPNATFTVAIGLFAVLKVTVRLWGDSE